MVNASRQHISVQERLVQQMMKVMDQCIKSVKYRERTFQNIDDRILRLKKRLGGRVQRLDEFESKLKKAGYYTKRAQTISLIGKFHREIEALKGNIESMVVVIPKKRPSDSQPTVYGEGKSGRINIKVGGSAIGRIAVTKRGFL